MLKTTIDIQLSFFCRSTHQYKNGENPIVMRVVYREQRADIFTGLTCPPKYWVPDMYLVNPKYKLGSTINKNLTDIQINAIQAFNLLKLRDEEFTLDQLVDEIKGKKPPPQTILEYIALKEEELKNKKGVDIAITTWYKYNRTIRYFRDFMKDKRGIKNIPVSKIDSVFIEHFLTYLKKEKKNSHNSATALMGCFSNILQQALKHKVIKYNPFVDVELSRKPVNREYLEDEEIERLQQLDDLGPELRTKRDIFLFAVFTGLAYGDFPLFSKNHIRQNSDETYYLNHPREKNGVLSIVPLLPPAIRILESYSATGDFRDFQWRVVSNQKMNSGLKVLARMAKINKKLFMHIGRHTFATTITISNGVSMESLSRMLGHTTLKHTQIYGKIVARKVKDEMLGVAERYK
jgi:site-specific recombinase XerD